MKSPNVEYGGQAGQEVLRRIGGDGWDSAVAPLADVSPDMARLLVDFAYGAVLSRSGLDLQTRQCCTIAILLVDGSSTAQLKFHLHGLLNVGGTAADAVELLTIAAAMAGFPAAIGSVNVLREVIAERGLSFQPERSSAEGRWARGVLAMSSLAACSAAEYNSGFERIAPDFAELTVAFEFGEVLSRPGLPDHVRRLVVIAMLAAMGNRAELLERHLAGALGSGIDVEQIGEVLIQLSVYAGFPRALAGFSLLRAAAPASGPAIRDPATAPKLRHDRRAEGLRTLEATSQGSGDAVVRSFEDVAPHLGDMIVDNAYGEIFFDQRLDPKMRELAAVATLASTMAEVDAGPLGVHIDAATNVGATPDEIVQTIVNVAPYSGFATAQTALSIAALRLGELEGQGRDS